MSYECETTCAGVNAMLFGLGVLRLERENYLYTSPPVEPAESSGRTVKCTGVVGWTIS